MRYNNFIKKLKTRLGDGIQIESEATTINGRREWLAYNGTIASWRVESNSGVEIVSSFHSKNAGDESDPHTDYYPGFFWNNGTQLIDRLKPSTPKYPVGSLVRGKGNKRATRLGYSDKVALVTEAAGKHMKLKFVEEEWANQSYSRRNMLYPVRDFELI